MIERTAGASIMMHVVRAIDVATGAFAGIHAILALSARTCGIPIVVNVAVQNLVVIGPNGNSASGPIFDFESIDDVVTTIDIDTDISIGSILAINDGAALNLRFQRDWTGRTSAFAEMNAPAAIIVGVSSRLHNNGGSSGGQTVCLHDSA